MAGWVVTGWRGDGMGGDGMVEWSGGVAGRWESGMVWRDNGGRDGGSQNLLCKSNSAWLQLILI